MRLLIVLIFFLIVTSCKAQLSDYEVKVYKLLNDAHTRNPKAPYKGEDAYIYSYHKLDESFDFLKTDLFQQLTNPYTDTNNVANFPTNLNDIDSWKSCSLKISNNQFDDSYIVIDNLHFKTSLNKSDSESAFLANIQTVLFNKNYAIMVIDLSGIIKIAQLYVLENGRYKSFARVSDPLSSEE